MSKPLTRFYSTVDRAEQLCEVHGSVEALLEQDDLLRSATVLAVAAYDYYFTSKFCDILNRHLREKKPSRDLLDMLSRAGLDTRAALEIAVMKRPFRRIRALLTNSLAEKTTHRSRAIDALFATIELHGLTGRVHTATNRKNLGKRIDKLVDARNSIVHSGHWGEKSMRKIAHDDTLNRIGELKLFVVTADGLINNFVEGKLPN